MAPVEELIAAIEAVDLGAPWSEVAPNLRPALPRRRPLPPGTDGLPSRAFPPGIVATLGLDIGPAMVFVGSDQLASWDISPERAFEQALANVQARVAARRKIVRLHDRIAGVPTVAFQSREGWASCLLLLPDELTRVLGERDGLVLAPMRDVLLHMPIDTEPDLAAFVLEEFAAVDPNALDLPLFALVDGALCVALPVPGPAPRGTPRH